MERYVSGRFTGQYKATIGSDFMTKSIVLKNGHKLSFRCGTQVNERPRACTDESRAAGQERFQSLGTAFYRGAGACILVFDASNPTATESLEKWWKEFCTFSRPEDPALFPFVVIANKIDTGERSTRAASTWCTSKNVELFEASAKDDTNVSAAFERVAELGQTRKQEIEARMLPAPIVLNQPAAQSSSCAC